MPVKTTILKGTILQYAGARHTKVYQVKQGLLRSYTIDQKGKEHIFMFAPEGWIIADSRPPDEPCDLFIDALEDSEVVIAEKKFEQQSLAPQALLKRIAVLQQRVLMLMSSPAIERYEHFTKTYPDMLQRVPQRMIASYLGITPEALSHLKRISKERGNP